ncbi:MAG: signal peptidase I [Candidatus Bathyarchaeia archaeon]
METLRRVWRNRYFWAVMDVALALILSLAILFSLRLILGVEHPLLVVSSGSMIPTLNIGDMIVVQTADPSQVNIGDVVVFRNPINPNEPPIVHRVISIDRNENGRVTRISTAGDRTRIVDRFSPWNASLLIGRVILRVPYFGNLYLFLHQWGDFNGGLIIIIIAAIVILIALTLFTDNKDRGEKSEGERKVGVRLAYIAAVNMLIISFMVFSLWGFVIISRETIILGMYRDLQLNKEKFGNANLSWGFMTYRIDCRIGDSVLMGVPTFSWFQLSLLILITFNGREVFDLLIRPQLKRSSLRPKNPFRMILRNL